MLRIKLLFLCLIFLLVAFPDSAIGKTADSLTETLRYEVDFSEAKNHYIHVTLQAQADDDETELMMAVWTPGSYLVRDHSRHLDSLVITDGDDQALDHQKVRKNRWSMKTQPGQTFRVHYRLYCNEVTVRTNFVGHRFAVLNGAPTYLTIRGRENSPHRVTLKMCEGWNRSASSLATGEAPNEYLAQNFDELVDSPIVAGQLAVFPFEVEGTTHQLVNVGESGYWSGTRAVADLAKMVKQQRDLWGGFPYSRYLFINVIAEGRGGLEHDSSCVLLTSRWAFRNPEKYQDWISLASHELFHAWNVRRLRPKPLVKYDYESEVYTESLWVAEGITSYYQDVMLARSGLIEPKAYLKRLSKKIEQVQMANGHRVQSLRDASFDTWIKHYRPDENSPNTRVSYYAKGAVAAFLLDAEIRQSTEGEKSLDDVMRLMFDRHRLGGYTEQEFRETATEVAGRDLSAWLATIIDTTEEIDYSLALDWYGLEFGESDAESEKDTTENASKPATADRSEKADAKDLKPWLGITINGAVVKTVHEGGPAFEAGINPGDELIAINHFRLQQPLEDHLKQFEVGDQIEIIVDRVGELIQLGATVSAKPDAKWTLQVHPKASESQKQRIKVLLGSEEKKP